MKLTPGSRLPAVGLLVALLVGAAGAGAIVTSGAPFAARLLGHATPGEHPDGPAQVFPRPAGASGTPAATTVSPTPTPTPPSSASATPSPTTSTPSATHRPTSTTTAPPSSRPPPSTVQQVLLRVNQERAAAGCQPLTEDGRLDTAARLHSADMASRNYFSHDTPEGVTFDQRERAAGYPSPGGENIAQGYRSADEVMQGWMQSPGHRENILDCGFTTMGVGLDTRGWYWTQDFGR